MLLPFMFFFCFFPVHQWRRLPSLPEDIFRSGGLPCGSLPEALPLLSELWTRPRRQYQWDYAYTLRIQTARRLHATFQQTLITLHRGLFGVRSFIATSPHGAVCVDMVTREFTAPSLSPSPLSVLQRRSSLKMSHVTSLYLKMDSLGTNWSVSFLFLLCPK